MVAVAYYPPGDRLVSPISYRWLNAVAGATLPGPYPFARVFI